MKTYPVNQSPLFRLSNKRKLAKLLGVPISMVVKNIGFDSDYKVKYIDKKGGRGKRIITYPIGDDLVKMQTRLFHLLSKIERPNWVKSAHKGENYITNARMHEGLEYGMKTDISDFYGSVTYKRVRKMFLDKFEMPSDIAEILTRLVTCNRTVPSGSSTSMLVTYYSYEKMFESINNIASARGIVFSLYVDDLSFSAHEPIGSSFFKEVRDVIKSYGLNIKWKKTSIYDYKVYREFTGVGISPAGVCVVPNYFRKNIIDNYRECIINGVDAKKINSLRGKVNAARQIETDIFPQIMTFINKAEI